MAVSQAVRLHNGFFIEPGAAADPGRGPQALRPIRRRVLAGEDRSGEFPHELHAALAAAGWLGIAMPEEYGGAGLGITEAVIMMQAIAESGAAMSGASAVHMNIFGLQPVIVFGTDEQKRRSEGRRVGEGQEDGGR